MTFTTYEPSIVRLTDKLIGDAEKLPIQSWELAGSRFRITDTTPAGWEENDNAEN